MNPHEILLKQLDAGLALWGQANSTAPRPRGGWVRTLRKALGMTIVQLARRSQRDPSRVAAIEAAEPKDSITLKTLREMANAMECDLVYALVPRTSLKSILEKEARRVLSNRVQQVSHSMALEDQAVSKGYQEDQVADLVKQSLSKPRLLSSIWNANKPHSRKQISQGPKKSKQKKPKGKS